MHQIEKLIIKRLLSPKHKKVIYLQLALLIDGLIARGGGERTAYFFAKRYAIDIYTAYVDWNKILPEFKNFNVNQLSKTTKVPFLNQELLLRKFRALDLSGYDAVICLGPGYSTYSAINNHPSILYAFGLSPLFYKRGKDEDKFWPLGKLYLKPFVTAWKIRLKDYDKYLMTKAIDKIIGISNFTNNNILKYYGRNAEMVGLPVETRKYYSKKSDDYYLTVDRLVPGKRVDIIIKAFTRMPNKKLIVEGIGPEMPYLKRLAGDAKNITFIGRVDSKKLLDLYSRATALISMSYQQDWSMVMVEAMAAGKPGIGPKQGAYKEIIIPSRTGVLVDATPEGVIDGVNKLDIKTAANMKSACMATAAKYDESQFYKKWDAILESVINR